MAKQASALISLDLPNRLKKRNEHREKAKPPPTAKDYDFSDYPDKPTPFERTLSCSKCGTAGHAKRTCKKRALDA